MSQVLNEYPSQESILIPSKIRFNSELTFGEKMFLAEIESMSSHGKNLTYSARSLSSLFGVSHQTISNWVKKLINMGYLEMECNFSNPSKRLVLKPKIHS